MRLAWLLAAAAASAPLLAAAPALANGRYPLAGQIAVDPDDPKHLVVRATYGVIVTRDGGKTWGWVCEPSIGYNGSEDPMLGVAHGGNLLAAIFAGLSVSKDGGCDFSLYPPLKKKYVVDLAIDKVAPADGVLIVSNSAGANLFLTQLWETSDGGDGWAQAGVDLPSDFIGLTVDSAPSDPATVYVSGRFGPPDYAGALEKTTDRGASWQKLPIPNSDNLNLPYVGAVDPHDPGVVYVRLDADAKDTLVVTRDGGQTYTQAFQLASDLLGFALSPDGTKVAVSSKASGGQGESGVWVADTTTLAFQKKSKVGATCLTWTAEGLYACADDPVDGFEVGLSHDEGASFTPLFH
ncbi:MAG TPA: hypothetical protein VHB21_23955, partial [Minicystis sp.]|nr:hypothetical protein [Minicystis sp.]